MGNIREKASFNSRLLELRNAYLKGDTKTVRYLLDSIKSKKEYYDTVTVESLNAQVEQTIEKMSSTKGLTASEREYYNNEIANLREEIIEKKEFVKNEKLINQICAENLHDELETKTNRIKRNRTLVSVAAVVGGVILIALAAKGCSKDKTNKTDNTIPTTTITYSDETISTSDYSNEETAPIDYFDLDSEYSIDPVIGEPTQGGYGSYGSSTGTTGGTTTGPTSVNGNPSATPTPYMPNIPGVSNYSDVNITYNSDGHIEEIRWTDPTQDVPMPNTDPTGNDPLPVEPSHVVNPDTTPDTPPTSPTTAPTSGPTPAVPTGNVPGEQPTVYPTEPSVPVPTDASEPSAPTAAPTDPTSAPTLPDIPTWDLDSDEVIEYDMNGHVVSNTMSLRR